MTETVDLGSIMLVDRWSNTYPELFMAEVLLICHYWGVLLQDLSIVMLLSLHIMKVCVYYGWPNMLLLTPILYPTPGDLFS